MIASPPSQSGVKYELKTTCVDWLRRSKFDIFVNLIDYNYFLAKLVWFLVLTVFFGLTAWLVALNLIDYTQYVSVSQVKLVYERPAPFPAVTICDSNPFTSVKAQDFMQSLMYYIFREDLTSRLSFAESLSRLDLVISYAKIVSTTKAFRSYFGFPRTIFKSCLYESVPCDESKDLHAYYSYEYGNCWQFNVGLNLTNHSVALRQVTTEGMGFGLSLTLTGLADTSNKYASTQSKGLVVFVHNQSYAPTDSESVFIE